MSQASAVVEAIARALADVPNEVRVVQSEHRGIMLLEFFMAPGDLGHVIGRQGRTATAVRTLATLAAEREGQRVQVEFRDEQA